MKCRTSLLCCLPRCLEKDCNMMDDNPSNRPAESYVKLGKLTLEENDNEGFNAHVCCAKRCSIGGHS